jgi:succinoglycan biosynthesis transport protein ExoP
VQNNSDNRRAEWLEPPAEEEGLRRYVETIRERIGLVLLAVIITTGMAVAYVVTAEKTYEATADVLVTPVATDNAVVRTLPLIFESSDPTRDVETASQFVTNLNVATRAKKDLGSTETARSLLNRVTAEPVAQSNIVAVTATDSSPAAAQQLANAFVTATIEERTDELHRAVRAQLPTIQAQLVGLRRGALQDTIAAQVAQLEALASAPDPSMRVQSEADLPTSQASPRPVLSVAGGIVAGVILGIIGAFAFQNLDPRLRREGQLRRLYRLPILARIPREGGRSGRGSPLGPRQLSGAGSEAYRTLRSTLETTQPDGSGSRVILVTGASPSEGKSTTAVNLASSIALAGKRVILIEADLRRPALASTLNLPAPRGGVVGVLIENLSLQDALTPTPTYGANLQVLLADYEGGWIAELFSIPAAQRMIQEARQLADYVIIDSPPLNEVVDALPLARQSDEVVIVVRLGKTRLDRLSVLAELLAENGIRPVGFAVVGVPRPSRGAYAYYRAPTDGDRPDRSLYESTEGVT